MNRIAIIITALALAGCDQLPGLVGPIVGLLPTPEEFCAYSDTTKARVVASFGSAAEDLAAACEIIN